MRSSDWSSDVCSSDLLALAVELGDAAPLVGSEFDLRHVAHQHRGAALGFKDDLLDVLDPLEIPASAHHELELGQLDRAAAHVRVAGADRLAHLRERDTQGPRTDERRGGKGCVSTWRSGWAADP